MKSIFVKLSLIALLAVPMVGCQRFSSFSMVHQVHTIENSEENEGEDGEHEETGHEHRDVHRQVLVDNLTGAVYYFEDDENLVKYKD